MTLLADNDRERKINDALAAYRSGDSSIRNLALKYALPRSTLRDRIKRAKISKETLSPQAKRAAMLKERSKVISDKQTKDSRLRERETVIQEALRFYNTDIGGKEGLRSVAAKFGIPRSTLRGRILGSISSKHRVQKGQKLTLAEEDVIVSCVMDLCKAGEEVTSSRVRNMANVLQQYRLSAPGMTESDSSTKGKPKSIDPETGKVNQVCLGWVRGFLGRHSQLIDAKGRILDAEKTKKLTREMFDDWFSRVKQTIIDQGISADNVYNFDSTSIRISQLITDGQRQIVSSNSLPHEFVTSPQPESFGVLECCSGSGKAMEPFLVFRNGSSYFDSSTLDSLRAIPEISNWSFNHSCDGSINEEVLLNWFSNWFDRVSSQNMENPSQRRVLIGDFSTAQRSKLFQEACQSRNVEFISLPDDTAHELQPLDIAVFAKVKRNFCMKVEAFFKTADELDNHKLRDIPATDLISCFYHARRHCVAKHNIQKAFKLAGLQPFDPAIVLDRVWDPTSSVNLPYDSIIVENPAPPLPAACISSGFSSSESDEERNYTYPSHRHNSLVHLLNTPVHPNGVADLLNSDIAQTRAGSSLDIANEDSSGSSPPAATGSTSYSNMESSGYRNIAISALIVSPPQSSSEPQSSPTTLPVLKELHHDHFQTSNSAYTNSSARPVIQNDPLPSLPDFLATTPRAPIPLQAFVEIAPLQSHGLLHPLQTSQVVPLPSFCSSIIKGGSLHTPPKEQHFPALIAPPVAYSEQSLPLIASQTPASVVPAAKTSSLDYICNRDTPGPS